MMRLCALEGVFDRARENLDHYTWITSDDQVKEAMDRLIALVASAMQLVATDITNGLADNPQLTPEHIVAALRARATELQPQSARDYDPGDEERGYLSDQA